jgi:hypothetical protein
VSARRRRRPGPKTPALLIGPPIIPGDDGGGGGATEAGVKHDRRAARHLGNSGSRRRPWCEDEKEGGNDFNPRADKILGDMDTSTIQE